MPYTPNNNRHWLRWWRTAVENILKGPEMKYPYPPSWVDSNDWAGFQPPLSLITWFMQRSQHTTICKSPKFFISTQHHTVYLMKILENICMDRIWKPMISGLGRSRRQKGWIPRPIVGIHFGLRQLKIYFPGLFGDIDQPTALVSQGEILPLYEIHPHLECHGTKSTDWNTCSSDQPGLRQLAGVSTPTLSRDPPGRAVIFKWFFSWPVLGQRGSHP